MATGLKERDIQRLNADNKSTMSGDGDQGERVRITQEAN